MTAQQLKNAILQEAIEGRLVPQDPNDEPASVLLERIHKEKERLVKEGKLKKKDLEVKPISEDEIPFEIPESWEWVRLVDVGIAETGTTPSKSHPEYFGTFIPFLGPANMLNGQIISETQGLSEIGANYGRIVPEGSILQVCIGGSIGKCAIVDKPVTFNQQINSITPLVCVIEFIYYVLQSDYFRLAIKEKSTGTATPIINRGNWEQLVIPLPPLAEQHRIVAKIEELLPKVEEYGKAQDELNKLNEELPERLKKSILQEAIEGRLVPQDPNDEPASVLLDKIRKEKEQLVKEGKLKKSVLKEIPFSEDEEPFDIPDSWEWCKLGWIGDWGAGATPAKGNPDFYNNGTIPWLRTGELNNGFVYDSEIKVTPKALEKCSLRMCEIGDVLIAMYGATIGKVAIAGIQLTTNQACCACTPYGVYNKYLLYYLMASQKTFTEMGEGGAQPNISREKIVAFPFALPPLAEQHRIVEKLEKLLCETDKLKV
jgi:Restriction endonuclease S subunits